MEAQTQLRAIKVTYSNGAVITTSMAKGLSDESMLDYFAVGKEFNLGRWSDNMQKVKSREILR